MFVKEVSKELTRTCMYKLFYKHDQTWAGNVIINLQHVPKIGLIRNAIIFHLPTHNQIIEYKTHLDAETEYDAIYKILNE